MAVEELLDRVGKRVSVAVVLRALREFALMAALFLAYKAVRLAVAGRVDEAFANAHRVIDAERTLHIGIEQGVQSAALHSRSLIVALDRYYVSMHFITFVVFLIWIFASHRDLYPHLRR